MIPPSINFKWLGPEVECCDPSLESPKHIFYESFIYNDETYAVGDFILVKVFDGSRVARLVSLYESLKKNGPCYFGTVTWFTKASALPKAITKNIVYDEKKELVEDLRNKDRSILLESIIEKCCVVFGTLDDSIHVIKNMNLEEEEEELYFSCRFKLSKNKLSPLLKSTNSTIIEEDPLSLHDFTPDVKAGTKKFTPNHYKNSPVMTTSSTPSKVKRNLNESFDSQPETPVLNYSIINEDSVQDDLKIKLRISKEENTPKKNKDSKLGKEVKVLLKTIDTDYVVTIPKESINEKNMRKLRNSVIFNENNYSPRTTRSGRISKKTYAEDYIFDEFEIDKCSIRTPKKRTRSSSVNVESQGTPVKNKKVLTAPPTVVEEIDPVEQFQSLSISPRKRACGILREESQSTPKKSVKIEEPTKTPTSKKKSQDQPTPSKGLKVADTLQTPRTRRKLLEESTPRKNVTIVAPSTPSSRRKKLEASTPSKLVKIDEDPQSPSARLSRSPLKTRNNEEFSTPKKNSIPKTPKNTPGARMKLIRQGVITPSMHSRKSLIVSEGTPLQEARNKLHVSYVPKALPCREKEFEDILNFVEGKLWDGFGGCMYVSGVPGTGKTATVTEVIRTLQSRAGEKEIPKFTFVGINGMKLTEPRQAYVEILKQLTGKTVPWEQAHSTLDTRFTKKTVGKKSEPIVLLVDELDILCTKRQDVVYNLLDWPTKALGQLIVITIANTMDLPERLLMGRVTSRLGLTRLTFQAYTYKQLQEIVMKRLMGTDAFNPDAVQLVARKVASVSGDARRALDICRKSAEVAELEGPNTLVSMSHVNEALNAMITQPKVRAIKYCSRLEQLILQSVVAEVERTGVDETTFNDIFKMLSSVAGIDGFQMVSSSIALAAVSRLSACRLLLSDQKTNDLYQKIILNVSPDDIFYALRKD